jgi:hypothetical protein
VQGRAVDAERRQWLESVAAACESVLATNGGDRTDPPFAALLQDVADLLARVRAELQGAACS